MRSRRKSSGNLPKGESKRKESLITKIITRSGEIITENYQLVYQSRGKCEIYRDTGVSKNTE